MDAKELFATHCSGCHGAAGKEGPAPPLNDPLFLSLASDTTLRGVIVDGRPGHLMPAFGQGEVSADLSSAQIDVLVAGIRAWWSPASPPVSPAGPPAPPLAPSPRPADVHHGAEVYAFGCAPCHGSEGQGKEAGTLRDPAFLTLLGPLELRRIVITGRPDLGMPNYRARPGKPLDERDVTDVVAFVWSWSGHEMVPAERPTAERP